MSPTPTPATAEPTVLRLPKGRHQRDRIAISLAADTAWLLSGPGQIVLEDTDLQDLRTIAAGPVRALVCTTAALAGRTDVPVLVVGHPEGVAGRATYVGRDRISGAGAWVLERIA